MILRKGVSWDGDYVTYCVSWRCECSASEVLHCQFMVHAELPRSIVATELRQARKQMRTMMAEHERAA